MEEISQNIYDNILIEAKAKANILRIHLPELPGSSELDPIKERITITDGVLIDVVKDHLSKQEAAHGHGFDHLEWAATLGTYVAFEECHIKHITGEEMDQIIQRTWRLGLMHDIERYRGYGQIHQLEGAKRTQIILDQLGIFDPYLVDQVLVHDDIVIEQRNEPQFDIPMFSIFAVDHLNWGLEWEEIKWTGLAKKGVSINEAIHDYQYMYRLRNSPNLLETEWGKNVAIPYIDFGIEIAKYIEDQFS